MPLASVTKRPDRSAFGKGLAPQLGWPPSFVRDDPDLENPRRDVFLVIFGVTHARTRAHYLDVARCRAALIAQAVRDG